MNQASLGGTNIAFPTCTTSVVNPGTPLITSGKIIRSIILAVWLKTKDLRIVQYMAGHKYVSSTDRYNVFNMQELKEALDRYHPLKLTQY